MTEPDLGCMDTLGAIVLRHILSNMASPLVVQATVSMAGAVSAEASLSYLGLGVQPPNPHGAGCRRQRRCTSTSPHGPRCSPG